ncbi:MAG: relaxase/mobilization nuclease domain-containing protein [Bacteroidales bacterium]|jgi:hypothetical protein|nr:relaxase/mobilization nuclease domain-containing protein [Bacteroidales bacterium]
MIPKILPSGRTFTAIFRYNEKNASEFLGIENFPSDDKIDLMNYFETFGVCSNVSNQVFHCSIALRPGENVSDETFKNIAGDYMNMMGYGDQPYAMYRHYDKGHQHLHLVSSRVNFETLRKINDSNEKFRSMAIADHIEKKYNLYRVERTPGKTKVRLPEGIIHEINEKLITAMEQKPVTFEELQTLTGQDLQSLKASRGVVFFNLQANGRGRGVASSQLPIFREKSLKQQLYENRQEKIKDITMSVNAKVSAALDKKPQSIEKLSKLLGDEIKVIASKKGITFQPASSDYWVSSSKLQCLKDKSLKQQINENLTDWRANKQQLEGILSQVLHTSKNIEDFQNELLKVGIQHTLHSNSGGVYGISFSISGFEFKGSETGKNYTWTALNRHFDRLQPGMKKSGKPAKTKSQIKMPDTGKVIPSLKLGHVSTAEDDWKRRRKKRKYDEENEEKNISI